jgi:leucyl-tRNA synthetase
MRLFNFRASEKKWIKQWDKEKLFELKKTSFSSPRSKNKYVLVMFPYPSGEGLHVGHVEGYTAADIYARFTRMKGNNVLHPMGWDAFGLPAENYAIKHKIHPSEVVKKNVANFKRQLKSLGFSYDWSREINTTDPEYYKWTQWIFLQLFKEGLAYEKEMPVNWCPSCKTVLSDEEVEDGVCDRCESKVERRNLKQWMLKITAYAERLLKDLDLIQWPERVKTMQKNWIGKSEGAIIRFPIVSQTNAELTQIDAENSQRESALSQLKSASLEVFTTRPDTIFGASYLVLAPEHTLVAQLGKNIKNFEEVTGYSIASKNKSDQDRISETKEKTGVRLEGINAINPANGKKMSVWVADYVLPYYGTGAIMAVPAHDQRDWDFAKKYGLPIVSVISPDGKTIIDDKIYEGDGILINSGRFDGKENRATIPLISDYVKGKEAVQYKLRDWIFSRQRYWGEPIPLVFCRHCAQSVQSQINADSTQIYTDKNIRSNQRLNLYKSVKLSAGELLNPGWIPVDEKDLPLKLPNVKKYQPTGTLESPLAGVKDWVNVKCPRCGGDARRETNTMPQWAGSCWYYLRYIDPKNKSKISDPKKEKAFMPVDMYIGGVEHAVLHLLYARFWHKFLYDKKIVKDPEPFTRLVNQGLILGGDGEKMSKSRGNVVNPDDIIKEFGADALRMYEMFMGPLEDSKPWNTQGIIGITRFLNRVWAIYQKTSKKQLSPSKLLSEEEKNFERLFHQTLKKVTSDIEILHFNTAISAMMVLIKEMEALPKVPKRYLNDFIAMLSPFAPFMCESIWREILKNKKSVLNSKWPSFDTRLIHETSVQIAVQINGRTRGTIAVPLKSEKEFVLRQIEADPKFKIYLADKEIKRVVFVPDRIINILL